MSYSKPLIAQSKPMSEHLCTNFDHLGCSFGDHCHYQHGVSDVRNVCKTCKARRCPEGKWFCTGCHKAYILSLDSQQKSKENVSQVNVTKDAKDVKASSVKIPAPVAPKPVTSWGPKDKSGLARPVVPEVVPEQPKQVETKQTGSAETKNEVKSNPTIEIKVEPAKPNPELKVGVEAPAAPVEIVAEQQVEPEDDEDSSYHNELTDFVVNQILVHFKESMVTSHGKPLMSVIGGYRTIEELESIIFLFIRYVFENGVSKTLIWKFNKQFTYSSAYGSMLFRSEQDFNDFRQNPLFFQTINLWETELQYFHEYLDQFGLKHLLEEYLHVNPDPVKLQFGFLPKSVSMVSYPIPAYMSDNVQQPPVQPVTRLISPVQAVREMSNPSRFGPGCPSQIPMAAPIPQHVLNPSVYQTLHQATMTDPSLMSGHSATPTPVSTPQTKAVPSEDIPMPKLIYLASGTVGTGKGPSSSKVVASHEHAMNKFPIHEERMCTHWASNSCKFGDMCIYRHGDNDPRRRCNQVYNTEDGVEKVCTHRVPTDKAMCKHCHAIYLNDRTAEQNVQYVTSDDDDDV